MNTSKRILFFFILPIFAVLLYPLSIFESGLGVIAFALIFFIGLGIFIMRGRELALTFAIFLQGMNVIIRIMMFWSNSVTKAGVLDIPFIITTTLAMILSVWLLLRLDRQDIRIQMTH
ncbi:MAG TPA: hypothetical protein PJ988_14285 [Anaerolinea sp.]|nr:hypothetical protein [Anaerolinea sp.]